MAKPPIEHEIKTWTRLLTNDEGLHAQTSGEATVKFISRSGGTTPGFSALRKARALPINDYSKTRFDLLADQRYKFERYMDFHRYSDVCNSTYYIAGYPVPLDVTTEEADRRANGRLLKELAELSPNDFNAGVAFAERKQTANMIADTTTRMYRAMLALKRANLVDMYKAFGLNAKPTRRQELRLANTPASRRLSSHWLEYTFGWTPLLSDIDSAAKLLARHVVGLPEHGTIAGSCTVTKSRTIQGRGQQTISEMCKVKYGVKYRLDSPARQILASTGITNPLTVAWEVLPYSFVVDWFLPVSNYLKNLQAFDGFEIVQGFRSRRWEQITDLVFRENTSRAYADGEVYFSQQEEGRCRFRYEQYSRAKLATFPRPAPPTFRNPIGDTPFWKFATSMALIRQVMK